MQYQWHRLAVKMRGIVPHPQPLTGACCRHREQKKLEKQQQRLDHLQSIHHEAYEKGDTRLAEAAGGEAERLQRPWLQRNVPVKPPAYASVSGGMPKQVRVVDFAGNELPRDDSLGLATETRRMSVLNFKVGYAVDAQYALPEEVISLPSRVHSLCLSRRIVLGQLHHL